MTDAKNIPVQANQIKVGHFAVLRERPCKIIHRSVSKTGKHGHAKIHFVGTDVFTGKKYEDICPSTHTMLKPILVRTDYDLLNVDDENYATLMTSGGGTREDIQIPKNSLGEDIIKVFENDIELSVLVLSWGDEEAIISFSKLK